MKDSDYQLTGSTSGTPLATQNTPDGLPPSSLPGQQTNNHLQGLPAYSHNDYNNYPTLPVSTTRRRLFRRDLLIFPTFLPRFPLESAGALDEALTLAFSCVLLFINADDVCRGAACCAVRFSLRIHCWLNVITTNVTLDLPRLSLKFPGDTAILRLGALFMKYISTSERYICQR